MFYTEEKTKMSLSKKTNIIIEHVFWSKRTVMHIEGRPGNHLFQRFLKSESRLDLKH